MPARYLAPGNRSECCSAVSLWPAILWLSEDSACAKSCRSPLGPTTNTGFPPLRASTYARTSSGVTVTASPDALMVRGCWMMSGGGGTGSVGGGILAAFSVSAYRGRGFAFLAASRALKTASMASSRVRVLSNAIRSVTSCRVARSRRRSGGFGVTISASCTVGSGISFAVGRAFTSPASCLGTSPSETR